MNSIRVLMIISTISTSLNIPFRNANGQEKKCSLWRVLCEFLPSMNLPFYWGNIIQHHESKILKISANQDSSHFSKAKRDILEVECWNLFVLACKRQLLNVQEFCKLVDITSLKLALVILFMKIGQSYKSEFFLWRSSC